MIRHAAKAGKKVIVATNDGYDSYFLPTVGTVICTFSAMPWGARTAAGVIYGKLRPGGVWPFRSVRQDETIAATEVVDHFTAGYFAAR